MRSDYEELFEKIRPFLIRLGEGIGDPAEDTQEVIHLVGNRYHVLAKAGQVADHVIQRGFGWALTFCACDNESLYARASERDDEMTMTRLSPALIRIATANLSLADPVLELVTERCNTRGLYYWGQDKDEAPQIIAELEKLASACPGAVALETNALVARIRSSYGIAGTPGRTANE